MKNKRMQVNRQARAVVSMAESIASVYRDLAPEYLSGHSDAILDIVGERSARYMEILGDMMNEMDIVTKEDDWIHPIMEAARRNFPAKPGDDHG